MGKYLGILLASLFFFGAAAHGQVLEPFPVPGVDPLAELMLLIRDWKAMSPLALTIGIVILTVQMIKSFAPGFKYTRLAVTICSVIYGVLLSVQQGMSWQNALVVVVITGGGAVAIYEAWKGLSKALVGGEGAK